MNKERILIAVDSGKYAVKALAKYQGQVFSTTFRTKMQSVNRLGVDIQPGSYLVQYNADSYLIGDMNGEEFSDYALSKTSSIHQLSIYTAIANLLQKAKAPAYTEVKLAVNVPIATYKDSVQKETFKKRIENANQTINLVVNGQEMTFDLKDVTIGFEGMGEIYANPELYRDKGTIIVDIGGLNTTLCQFKGLNPVLNTMVVSDLGINVLKGKIGKRINEMFSLTVSQDDLEQILRSGYFASRGIVHEESKTIIEETKWEHLQQIIQFARSRQYTFNMADIHFVGGGAYTLRTYIKREFPNAQIVANPQFANCRSFLKILEVKNQNG